MRLFRKHLAELIALVLALAWIVTNAVVEKKRIDRNLVRLKQACFLTVNKVASDETKAPSQKVEPNPKSRKKLQKYAFIAKRNIFNKDGRYKNMDNFENLPPLKRILKKPREVKKKKKREKISLVGILFDGQGYHAIIRKSEGKISFVDVGSSITEGVEVSKITKDKLIIIEGKRKKTYQLFHYGKRRKRPFNDIRSGRK